MTHEPDLEGLRRDNRRKEVLSGLFLLIAGLVGVYYQFKWPGLVGWSPNRLVILVLSYLTAWYGLLRTRSGLKGGKDDHFLMWGGSKGLFLGLVIIAGLVLLVFIYIQGFIGRP